ncbi:MAG: hypothetical protein JJU11_03960 [Candidatus Sumerlaeia bacterium]|nr:hypothetical protein [Candidatus Sumerlaeia bacterium]
MKLTDNESQTDVYLNPAHIVRFLPDPSSEGTLIFLTADAGIAPRGEAQILMVHEPAEEIYRIISRNESRTAGSGKAGANRGLL